MTKTIITVVLGRFTIRDLPVMMPLGNTADGLFRILNLVN